MKNAIEVRNLTKNYNTFSLNKISLHVPNGYVCGFIGENGAGKTTTLKLMLSMIIKDDGEVELLGKSSDDLTVKEELGVLFEQPYFQEDWTPVDVEKALQPFYRRWNCDVYRKYLKKFSLNPKQKYKTMSRGMKMKLGMAVTLSHDAKLLLLDEPTGGLDPVMRDELLETLREYMALENRSIFFQHTLQATLKKLQTILFIFIKGKSFLVGLKMTLSKNIVWSKGATRIYQRRNAVPLLDCESIQVVLKV